jgi:DNA-binding Xre family transcriptional regulator
MKWPRLPDHVALFGRVTLRDVGLLADYVHLEGVWQGTRELASKPTLHRTQSGGIEGGDYEKLRPSTMRRIAEALDVQPGEVSEFAPDGSATGGS